MGTSSGGPPSTLVYFFDSLTLAFCASHYLSVRTLVLYGDCQPMFMGPTFPTDNKSISLKNQKKLLAGAAARRRRGAAAEAARATASTITKSVARQWHTSSRSYAEVNCLSAPPQIDDRETERKREGAQRISENRQKTQRRPRACRPTRRHPALLARNGSWCLFHYSTSTNKKQLHSFRFSSR